MNGRGFMRNNSMTLIQKQAAAIRELQQESRELPIYKDKVVVPLRRGVIEFVPDAQEDIGRSACYYRFQKYTSHLAA